MNPDRKNSEMTIVYEDEDQCPECGHVWPHDRQLHFRDCGYHADNRNEVNIYSGAVASGPAEWARFEESDTDGSSE